MEKCSKLVRPHFFCIRERKVWKWDTEFLNIFRRMTKRNVLCKKIHKSLKKKIFSYHTYNQLYNIHIKIYITVLLLLCIECLVWKYIIVNNISITIYTAVLICDRIAYFFAKLKSFRTISFKIDFTKIASNIYSRLHEG